jgi:hypothetical protein
MDPRSLIPGKQLLHVIVIGTLQRVGSEAIRRLVELGLKAKVK